VGCRNKSYVRSLRALAPVGSNRTELSVSDCGGAVEFFSPRVSVPVNAVGIPEELFSTKTPIPTVEGRTLDESVRLMLAALYSSGSYLVVSFHCPL